MGYLRHCTYCFGILFLVGAGSVFAIASTSDTKIMTNAYKAQEDNSKRYHQDAIIDLTSKLNMAIKKHPDLRMLSQACGGCDVILPSFDAYLRDNFPYVEYESREDLRKKLSSKPYGIIIIGNYLHQSVTRNLSLVDNKTINKALDDIVVEALIDIVQDADYQIKLFNDIKLPGAYTDGDPSNSPYDLIDGMQKIMKLIFQDPAQYEGYVNTMESDAPGLITGRFEVGQWAQGETYEIDLASDVTSAFGRDGDGGGSGPSNNGDDCEDGFCITMDIISNDSYSAGGRGTSFVDANFEEIFGSGLDWLIKKGDKRNLACKGPPPVNHFQSNNDLNLSFKNIFRGLGIFVFQKTPKYAKSDKESQKEKTLEEQEKYMDGVIADSFQNYHIDPDHLMLYTRQQMIEEATPNARKAGDTASNYEHTRQLTYKQASNLVAARRNEAVNDYVGIKNMFRSVGSWVQSFRTMVSDMLDISKAWDDKPDCKN